MTHLPPNKKSAAAAPGRRGCNRPASWPPSLVRSFRTGPAVEVSFVRYDGDTVVLLVTNQGQRAFFCFGECIWSDPNTGQSNGLPPYASPVVLKPGSATQLFTLRRDFPAMVSVECVPLPPTPLQVALYKAGPGRSVRGVSQVCLCPLSSSFA